jgi:hypothetical protein
MYTIPKPAQPQYSQEAELLQDLIDLLKAGEITAVLLPDGQIGWVPAAPTAPDVVIPLECTAPETIICPMCGGSGSAYDAFFELAGLCEHCAGTGIWEGK